MAKKLDISQLKKASSDKLTFRLSEIDVDSAFFNPHKTNTELDEFFSEEGGLLPGTVTICYGVSGAGKSTVLINILSQIKNQFPEKSILYVSSEMTRTDIYSYKNRVPGIDRLDILFLDDHLDKRPDHVLESIFDQGWDIILIDSFEDVISKCRYVTKESKKDLSIWLLDLMKGISEGNNSDKVYTTFLCTQHTTKEGTYKGDTVLGHNPTALLKVGVEDDGVGSRYLMYDKNRRGESKKKLYFYMDSDVGIEYDFERYKVEEESRKKSLLNRANLVKDVQEVHNILFTDEDEEYPEVDESDFDNNKDNG